jgi:cation/acetate symporter
VKEARESVTWSLFFIFLLYFTAPALAVLVKYEVFTVLVGTPFDKLPAWIAAWNKVDPALLSVTDINKDGILQLGEMRIGGDIIVLATPEIGGLPYVISGLVAAGGLAAALSTADGLLLTIANALSHDLYYKMIDPNASTARRVAISKALLLVVALAAASWRRRSRRTSCSWCRRRSRSRRRRSSRRWCWASSGSAPTSGARRWA